MNKLDNNFEKLKQSMLAKKLKAEANNKNVCKSVDLNTHKNADECVDKNVYTNVDNNVNNSDYNQVNTNTNVDVDVNKNTYTDVNIYDHNNTNTNVDKSVNKGVNSNVNIDVNNSDYKNVNKFIIKANTDENTLERYTIYLKVILGNGFFDGKFFLWLFIGVFVGILLLGGGWLGIIHLIHKSMIQPIQNII
ncbi:UNVERIFIED_CONTAM: hypothetical protein Cloal_4178 [Acetivibrio alkalicellulosi]